jgi:hypothetical protein
MNKEPTNKKDIWNPHFYKHFPGFASVLPLWSEICQSFQHDWPTFSDFNAIAQSVLTSPAAIQFIAQESDMKYEREIIEHGKIPMRGASWHDFFNNLTWLSWPKLKSAIVKRCSQELLPDSVQRTSRQNLLAHFDECGLILCSDKPSLFQTVKNFQWKSFFWDEKSLLQHCLPVIIGHGLLEKAIDPFIGLTAKAIFIQVDSAFFVLPQAKQFAYLDQEIATYILSPQFPDNPLTLQPFPFLGWPGWHPENHQEIFYENRGYFRKGRMNQVDIEPAYFQGSTII